MLLYTLVGSGARAAWARLELGLMTTTKAAAPKYSVPSVGASSLSNDRVTRPLRLLMPATQKGFWVGSTL